MGQKEAAPRFLPGVRHKNSNLMLQQTISLAAFTPRGGEETGDGQAGRRPS